MDVLKGKDKLTLGVLYRPPNLGRASGSKNVCFMGDFNYRNIDWEGMVGDLESEDFLKVIQDNFLKHTVTEPTRGNNILDLVLTNNENMVSELDVGGELGGSDHKEIRFNLDWAVIHKLNIVLVPDFRRANYEGLRRHLEEVNWRTLGLDEGRISEQEPEGQGSHVELTYNSLV